MALDNGRLALVGGTRKEARGDSRVEELVEIVKATPGILTGDAQALMSCDRDAKLAATRKAKEQKLIHDVSKGPRKLLYPGPSQAVRMSDQFRDSPLNGSNGG